MQRNSNDRWRAHTLRPKGAEALLHQKGEPCPTLNRQEVSRRGLTHRMEGSHATEGSQWLCCTGRKSLVLRRLRSITQTTDGGLTLRPKGAVGLSRGLRCASSWPCGPPPARRSLGLGGGTGPRRKRLRACGRRCLGAGGLTKLCLRASGLWWSVRLVVKRERLEFRHSLAGERSWMPENCHWTEVGRLHLYIYTHCAC